MTKFAIDLTDILEQSVSQVFGSDERQLLQTWLDRNSGVEQIVSVELGHRLVTQGGDGGSCEITDAQRLQVALDFLRAIADVTPASYLEVDVPRIAYALAMEDARGIAQHAIEVLTDPTMAPVLQECVTVQLHQCVEEG